MTERSLADLGWLDFFDVAWWLGLLYRRPHRLREALEELPKRAMLRAGAILSAHALVYAVIIATLGRLFLLALDESLLDGSHAFQAHVAELVQAFAIGIGYGLLMFAIMAWVRGIAVGIAVGIAGDRL